MKCEVEVMTEVFKHEFELRTEVLKGEYELRTAVYVNVNLTLGYKF